MTEPVVSVLGNGLRVVSAAMPSLETAAVGVWVEAGARHEPAALNGISHLLEHMAFKGTQRRSALAIAEEIETVGGHLNAYTSREHTAYVARVLKEDVPLAVDILADILQHATMPVDELAREREVVIQEIAQVHDTPDDVVFDIFQETAFPDQPLGRSILGTARRVASFDRDSLVAYMAENYTADRLVLAAAGRVDHAALVALAEDAFGGLRRGDGRAVAPARYCGGDAREARDLEQAHLVLGFSGVAYEDPAFFDQQVLATALGGGMSSRLFQEVREKRGLAYSIYAYASSYRDAGLFVIYAGTGDEHLAELVPVICDETCKCAEGIDDAEIDRARAQLKASLLMSLESPSARCEQAARHLLIFGRVMPTAEIIERIDAVDARGLAATARRLIAEGPPTVTALGPVAGLAPYEAIAARLG